MGPEILIVGDRTQRGSLLPRVQDLGYLVTPVRERELAARVEASPAPVAVLICLGDEDPANLIDAVRSGRDDVPVILYGSLGGAVHDLADVLELGADHFLAEPVGDEELASVLAEMAGPGDPAAGAEERENVLPITAQGAPGLITPLGAPGPASPDGDPVLGQLHRTLELLAARLHTEVPAEPERDGIDLAAMGLDAVPDVDAAAGNEVELDPDRGRRETSDPAGHRRPDSTLRLIREASGPRRSAPTRTPIGRVREPERIEAAAPGSTQRLPRVSGAVREDRSAVREDRSAVREDRQSSEETARVVARRDVSPRAGGDRLAGVEVVTRLARLHRQRGGGRVVVGFAGGASKEVWWRAGEPVFATSTAAADGLVARLVARGLVPRGEAAQAGHKVDGDLVASARRLVQAGLLKPREQAEAVRDVVESIVLSLCSDDAVRWSHDAAATPTTTVTLGVPVISLLARGARLGLSTARLREGLAGTTCLKVQEQDGLAGLLADPEAEGWLELLDGSRSLELLVAEDGLDERSLWSAACVLVAMGLATEVDGGASLVAIDRKRVSDRLALAQASDYFTLLGLARAAGRAEVVRAHADLRATFAPERLEPASRNALADELRELQVALDEARDVLLDEALRTAYLARITEEEA